MSAPSVLSEKQAVSSMRIHPTAIVDPKAQIGSDCYIGPYVIIGEGVTLGDRVHLDSHCVVDGRTFIGDDTRIFPFVSIGLPPQDLKFKGEASGSEIGRRTVIREFATIHRGTSGGGGLTKIGDDSFLMAQAHVAHDARQSRDEAGRLDPPDCVDRAMGVRRHGARNVMGRTSHSPSHEGQCSVCRRMKATAPAIAFSRDSHSSTA